MRNLFLKGFISGSREYERSDVAQRRNLLGSLSQRIAICAIQPFEKQATIFGYVFAIFYAGLEDVCTQKMSPAVDYMGGIAKDLNEKLSACSVKINKEMILKHVLKLSRQYAKTITPYEARVVEVCAAIFTQ